MKLMFSFEGTREEFLEVINHQVSWGSNGFLFSRKEFPVGQQIFFDLAFNLRSKEISGRAFISSEGDVRAQMMEVHAECQGLLGRSIPQMSYHPAESWEGSIDSERYVQRTGNKNFFGLSGFIPA